MPTIHHIALWTLRLEVLKQFYTQYFRGICGPLYINPKTQFSSYFITFEGGASLEIMSKTGIQDTPITNKSKGLAHLAFSFANKTEVQRQTACLREAGYTIVGEPRTTGDGYYESVILDPDGNYVECIYKGI